MRGRSGDGLANLLLVLLVERDAGRIGGRVRAALVRRTALGAGGHCGGAHGEAQGPADPFTFTHLRLNATAVKFDPKPLSSLPAYWDRGGLRRAMRVACRLRC